MNKLITHVPAGEVSADFQSAAAAWPLWDSITHPQKPKKSGKFLFDYSECRLCARHPPSQCGQLTLSRALSASRRR